ncbi:MAG: hypothetical protein EA398_01015 [Deltaproteobacteria bacterium]|nr:MAG: hypothetical protein EA398_01015 [Deltaproteobacteria bacterium]
MASRRQGQTLKDKVLNARIPEELDRELRLQAERLDVPVSQLVRNILQRTVDLVGNFSGNVEHLITDVVEDVAGFRDCAGSDGDRSALEKRLTRVLGWQEVRLQRTARCAWSARSMEPGEVAHLGIMDDGTPSVVLSPEGLDSMFATRTIEDHWVSVRLNRPASCAETAESIEAGEEAWILPGSTPLEVLSPAGYRRRTGRQEGTS